MNRLWDALHITKQAVVLSVAIVTSHSFALRSNAKVQSSEASKVQKTVSMKSEPLVPIEQFTQAMRELTLAGERPQAIAQIKARLNKAPRQRAQLLNLWSEITSVFVQEAAQAQFALAESIWLERPAEAFDVVKALVKTEKGQVQAYRLMARAASRASDCNGIQEALELINESAQEPEDVAQLSALLVDCRGGTAAIPKYRGPESLGLFFDLELRRLQRIQSETVSQVMVSTAEQFYQKHPGHPEARYWLWKTSPLERRDLASAKDYREKCTNMTNRLRLDFLDHPFLCLRLKEVEQALRSEGGANGR